MDPRCWQRLRSPVWRARCRRWVGGPRTQLVSKTSAGEPADQASVAPAVSASGRYVAFQSDAMNLPGEDVYIDVYVHDRKTGKTRLVSRNSAGDPGDGSSEDPAISGSGRYVAFESIASNLPGGGSFPQVYVHDRKTGKTRLASKNSAGEPADTNSGSAELSRSGRYLAFESDGDNLPGGLYTDVYVHDRETGKTRLASKNSAGEALDSAGLTPSISGSGRFVGFESLATNLPSGGTYQEVYLHDRKTGKTRLVSKTSGGERADGDTSNSSVSASGRYVAFRSLAPNLPGDDAVGDVYVHDRKTGKTRLVSRTSAGEPGDQDAYDPSISGSGRHVAFYSFALNLPGDDSVFDVYVHDRKNGKTRLASKTSGGEPADGDSLEPSMSGSGRYVGFYSNADNLPGTDSVSDVYLHGRLP